MEMKFTKLAFTPKTIDIDAKTITAVFSTDDVDRHGEIVDQKSWNLEDFKSNPVVLFSHKHDQPPVGRVISIGYGMDGKSLEGTIQFAADQYPFANVIWNLYRDGFMKAFSVGFSSGRVEMLSEGGVVLHENTLYELSTVSVPANAMALAKSKGLDISALEEKIKEVETETKVETEPEVESTSTEDTPEVETPVEEKTEVETTETVPETTPVVIEAEEQEPVAESIEKMSTTVEIPAIKIPSRKKITNKDINRIVRQLLAMKR